MTDLLRNSFIESNGPLGDINNGKDLSMDLPIHELGHHSDKKKKRHQHKISGNNAPKAAKARDLHYIIRDLMLALVLCHNVTPTYPNEDDPTYKEY